MSDLPGGTAAHRAEGNARPPVQCAVVTVSDSRTEATDESGDLLCRLLEADGHRVADRALFKNDEFAVRELVRWLLTRDDVDRTVEAVRPLMEKELPGFGEVFRMLSYQEQVGTAAILSRAVAGSAHGKLIVSMPGSKAAVELALTKVLLPEIRHLIRELRR
jgi:molybdenum cofactor biosynthesis protein B